MQTLKRALISAFWLVVDLIEALLTMASLALIGIILIIVLVLIVNPECSFNTKGEMICEQKIWEVREK